VAGRYQPNEGLGEGTCQFCATPTYSTGGAASCAAHPDNCVELNPSFVPGTGDRSACNIQSKCPAGKHIVQGAGALCEDCAAGTYADEPNADACKPCGSPAAYCPAGAVKPTKVQRGYVSLPRSAPADRRYAIGQCPPQGLDCLDGIAHIQSGYWMSPTASITATTEVNKCLRADSCTASTGTAIKCASGHTGLLCGVCEPGYGKAAGSCILCPPAGASHLLALAFVLTGACVALTLTRKTLPMMERGQPAFWSEWLRLKFSELAGCITKLVLAASGAVEDDQSITSVAGMIREGDTAASKRKASTLAIARIFINFLSMTSMLASFKLDWGSSLRWLFGIQKVLSGAMPPLMDCAGLDFVAQSSLALSLPLCIISAPLILIALWHVPHLHVQKKLMLGGAWVVPGLTLWGVSPWQVLPNAVLTLSFLLWPSFVASLLKMTDCSVVAGGVSYVVSDLTMSCDSGAHKALAGIATFYLWTLVPAFPLGILWLLQHNQGKLDDESFSQRFSFLYVGYTRHHYEGPRFAVSLCGRSCSWQPRSQLFVWWEVVVMARKFLLVAVTVWFGRNPSYQICEWQVPLLSFPPLSCTLTQSHSHPHCATHFLCLHRRRHMGARDCSAAAGRVPAI
jgi:hypothetical protein